MADTQIEATAYSFTNERMNPRGLVWSSPTNGYIFYINSLLDLVYRKTTDGGMSWSSTNAVSGSVSCLRFAIWYDKWTSGDTGDVIHICWMEDGDDDAHYNSFSVSDDTLDGEVIVASGSTTDGGATWVNNVISITKSRGGNIYVGGWLDNDGENFFARATDSPATSFTGKTSMADGNEVDKIMLLPGNEADSNDIWCLYQDVSGNQMTLKVYDDTADTWAETSAIDAIIENASWWGWDCTTRHSDGASLLAMWESHQATGTPDPACAFHELANSGSFTKLTDVHADDNIYSVVGMMINQQNDDIYVAYNTATSVTPIVYKKSVDGGSTWGDQTAMSETSDDHRLVMGGTSVDDAGGRWQPCWYNDDLTDWMTASGAGVNISVPSEGTNMLINVGDAWKDVDSALINIGDSWKDVASASINVGDSWKTIF